MGRLESLLREVSFGVLLDLLGHLILSNIAFQNDPCLLIYIYSSGTLLLGL